MIHVFPRLGLHKLSLSLGGRKVTYGMLLSSSSQHYKNPRDCFANWGKEI
jgi:hypothetical protein